MSRLACCWLVILLGLVVGCPGPENPYRPYPEPDYDLFVGEVQPVVQESCASLGCHGDHDRRLTLYAVDLLRADPSNPGAPLDAARLSEAELAWNYDALRIRIDGEEDVDTSWLLLKCLAVEQGGIVHADGETVFESTEAAGYQVLRGWIETGL